MSKIGKLWTDAVAYVALVLGAGLSIAGNVADTHRVRGELVDTLDIVLAVAWPALVVLMVEVFVSARWQGLAWPMQVLRWTGCLAIGAMAMRVSWVHLNDLLLSRSQEKDVAVIGPLAIDALAIMATALILAGRGQPNKPPAQLATAEDILADRRAKLDRTVARTTPLVASPATSSWPLPDPERTLAPLAELDKPAPLPMDVDESLARLATPQGDADMWARLEADMASGQQPTLPVPVSPAGALAKPESVPADAADLIMAWAQANPEERPLKGDVDVLVAATLGKTVRSARRWRTTLLPKS